MKKALLLMLLFFSSIQSFACSILYYIDTKTGKIYAVNNEDYWYDVKPYIKIAPQKKDELARLWYGWDDFAQGGINESGLFFDGASTPEQKTPKGCNKPKGNLGDALLAKCNSVKEALVFLEKMDVCITNGHLLFGDKTGDAAVVEWVKGEKKITRITGNHLMITNFLLSDTTQAGFPCKRYEAMNQEVQRLETLNQPLTLKEIGNVAAKAVQVTITDKNGREGGTLYSTFINITDMEFVMIYKLDNSKPIKFNLKDIFKYTTSQMILLD